MRLILSLKHQQMKYAYGLIWTDSYFTHQVLPFGTIFEDKFQFNIYQSLHQYHKILAVCNMQGERACEFSFDIVQSQYFVAFMK